MPFAETVKLNNGREMPVIGLGLFSSKTGGECRDAVKAAIKVGYRHFDGAALYGNEKEVGEGLKLGLQESKGAVKREDLFVTSKVWATKMHPDDVEAALRKTLSDLGLDFVDLYLIHWPHALARGDDFWPKDDKGNYRYQDVDPLDTWRAMEKIVEKGLAKSIGLSNFNSVQVKRIVDNAKIKPVINQVELHPYFPQEKLQKFCSDLGILLTAYSPLGAAHGLFQRPENARNLLQDPKIKKIGETYGKSNAQVVLRWIIQRGIAAVPKSSNPERLAANIDIFDFKLSDDEMKEVSSFDLGREGRFLRGHMGEDLDCKIKHYPFGIEF